MYMFQRAILIPSIPLLLSACAAGQEGLSDIHADIVSDYPSVTHLEADKLSTLSEDKILLLDIRDPDEFAVSHLPGAVQIDLDISETALLARIGDIQDKEIIVYCSVGRRSSIFADRMGPTLKAKGARSVSNLENGVFGWHNERRMLTDAEGQTDVVHPYDEVWKRYVVRADKARYKPE